MVSITCLSLRDAPRPMYGRWCCSVPLVTSMKPEKRGKVDASILGKLKLAVMVALWPGRRSNLVWLSATEAAAVVSGTGPSAGKIES
jgi:hypothetical protein